MFACFPFSQGILFFSSRLVHISTQMNSLKTFSHDWQWPSTVFRNRKRPMNAMPYLFGYQLCSIFYLLLYSGCFLLCIQSIDMTLESFRSSTTLDLFSFYFSSSAIISKMCNKNCCYLCFAFVQKGSSRIFRFKSFGNNNKKNLFSTYLLDLTHSMRNNFLF